MIAHLSGILARDPTRTTLIRQGFEAAIRRRFRKIVKELNLFLVVNDALGLKAKRLGITFLAQPGPRQFEFHTDAGKLTEFNRWFQEMIEAEMVILDPMAVPGKPWTSEYIESSYKMGLLNAYLESHREGLLEEGEKEFLKEEFMRRAFNAPEATSKILLLATRVFEELKGITASMGAEMNRILSEGMLNGTGITTIAREMADRLEIPLKRALRIARTEVIHAHAEGQLDAFEKLGFDNVGVKAEWSTAGDDRVCPQCSPMEGRIFSIEEAHGMIPLHPNCRCAWIPSV